jgi:hypothetical protein
LLFHEQANTFIMEKLCVFILNDDISWWDSTHVWNVGILQRDNTVLYCRRLSSSVFASERLKTKRII